MPIIKFIFKSQTFNINITSNDARHLPDNIFNSLISEPHIYQIQNDVSLEVFESFIRYFDQHELPNIQISNYYSYIRLNKELCIPAISNLIDSVKDQWEIELLNIASINDQHSIDKTEIGEEIAKKLDIYIVRYGKELLDLPIQSLYTIINHPDRKMTEHNRLYELIMQYYQETNNMEIFTLLPAIDARELNDKNKMESIDLYNEHGNFLPSFALSSTSTMIHDLKRRERNYLKMIAIMLGNSHNEIIENLKKSYLRFCDDRDIIDALKFSKTFKEITLENGLSFEINDNEMIAEMKTSNIIQNVVFIPHHVTHQSKDYVIKSFVTSAFENNKINSINFSDDSEIEAFEYKLNCTILITPILNIENNNPFSSLEYIKIPSSVKKFNEGWCCGFQKLINVEISPDNSYFKMLDNKFIVGKLEENGEIYDRIIFGRRDIEEITIPFYIKKIDSFCFEYCTKLHKIEICDAKLDQIWNYSFYSTSIESIKIPSSVTRIGVYAFHNCLNLKIIEIASDSKLELINDYSFSSTSIEYIKIPSSVTRIGEHAFHNCSNLKIIEIASDSKLELIDNYSFSSTPIEYIKIPSSVTKIGEHAFHNCSNLKTIEIDSDSKLEEIGKYSFSSTPIGNIKIPSSVTQIGEYSFYNCSNLKTVDIELDSKLEKIGKYSFSSTPIESIKIPLSVTLIDEYAFHNCSNLKTVDIELDSKLEKIGKYSFSSTSIESIKIPSNVTLIDEFAFSYCSKLIVVDIPIDSKLNIIGKFSFSLSQMYSYMYLEDKPPEINHIGVHAFSLLHITNIRIPSSITIIEEYAFYECSKLTSIEIPSDSKLTAIEKYAFANTMIESIELPSQLTYIDHHSFENCNNLKKVIYSSETQYQKIGKEQFNQKDGKIIFEIIK